MAVESRVIWTEPEQRVLIGDCREGMRALPAKSVQCCVTSSPYYGLRSYGTNPQIWGELPDCQHQWGESECGSLCQLCGAWRGELGSEPTPQMFAQNLAEVFSEVRRVLRDDGTLYLNLGESYAAQRGGSHQPAETLAAASTAKLTMARV